VNFKQYRYFYVNGSSSSEGGGLEQSEIREDSVMPIYKKIHGVEWNTKSDVNFGKRLEQIIGIKCINESLSGGGVGRLVRTTYDFIFKNWKEKDNFFIILEKPTPSISEVFFNKNKSYYTVNSSYKGNLDLKTRKLQFQSASREYFNNDYLDDKKYQNVFKSWFDNHYDLEERFLEDEKNFIGLYSFCKLHNIKVFLMNPNDFLFTDCFDIDDVIKFDNKNEICSIKEWSYRNKFTIFDEIKGYSIDTHPGYYGHIEYSKKLAKFLGWNGSIDIFDKKYH
jgi:hypothetical protein